MNVPPCHKMVNSIIETLFAAEKRRLQKWLNDIVTSNYEQHKLSQPVGFIYGGTYYRPDWQGTGRFPKRALHSSLWDIMDKWLADKAIINDDSQMISQALFGLMENCTTYQEVRDALPECLVNCIDWLKTMTRTRDELWTIAHDPRRLRQYKKLIPRIEDYTVSMLIY